MVFINSISCGQGAPSVYMIVMAGEGKFPADIVITADTGWETDMVWNTGERTNAKEYFDKITKPLSESYGIEAVFIRANGKNRKLPPIPQEQNLFHGRIAVDIPLFGSRGGRLKQSCTSKWKQAAVRQELRRRGARKAITNLGLTMDEVHRMKKGNKKWETLAWPLIDARLYRATVIDRLVAMDIPYLLSTECDGCPHKNATRWKRTSRETIDELAEFEKRFKGQYFLTDRRIPLKDAIADMNSGQLSLFEDDHSACDSGYCFT